MLTMSVSLDHNVNLTSLNKWY